MSGALRLVWVAATALGCVACSEKKSEVPSGLRVPLPDGWNANAGVHGLLVGPPGRVVLSLESRGDALPSAAQLTAAVGAAGGVQPETQADPTWVTVRYRLVSDGGSVEAFVGARKAGGHVIWCASTELTRPAELEPALGICRTVSQE